MSTGLRRKPLPGSMEKADTPPPPPPPSPPPTTTINTPDDQPSPPPSLEKEIGKHNIVISEVALEDGGSDSRKPLPPLPPPPKRWIAQALAHWRQSSKRRKCLYAGLALALLLLLILIPALSTTLKKHKTAKYNLSAPAYTGDLTYYDPGLGACGQTSTSHDYICAISFHLFDAASTSANPNTNPLCGRRLWFARTTGPGAVKKGDGGRVDPATVDVQGERVEVVVVDRCAGCEGEGDLDVTETAFGKVAGVDEGRVGVVWGWVD
jgi:hypothetical protein